MGLGRRAPRRRIALSAILGASAIGGMFVLAGSLEGFSHTWARLRSGDPAWIVAASLLELLSIGGYAVLFWSVVASDQPRIGWRASLEIPLAGIAALRLLATGGAGGFAVTAWALRRAGMPGRAIGARMVAALVVQYAIYALAVIVCGLGLRAGVFAGGGSFALTVTPALAAIGVAAAAIAVALLPAGAQSTRLGRRLAGCYGRPAGGSWGRARLRLWRWAGTAAATLHGGVRSALRVLAAPRPDLRTLAVLGALAYWGCDVAVLWCSFRAFGAPPALAVLVMGYFLGTLGGLLPLPAGVGGIEAGMIGAFIAFGVSPPRSIVAVLVYRLISFWLPTLPGVAGYLGLRRTVHGWQQTDARERASQRDGAPGPAAAGVSSRRDAAGSCSRSR